MPRGTRHRLTGILVAARFAPVLEIDGGGTWQLDFDQRYEHLLGRRVVVDGVRSDFDRVAVERIWPYGTPEPAPRAGIVARIARRLDAARKRTDS